MSRNILYLDWVNYLIELGDLDRDNIWIASTGESFSYASVFKSKQPGRGKIARSDL